MYQIWICSLLKEINKQTQYAVVLSASSEISLQTECRTFMAKADIGLSLGKSIQVGSQDFYHENTRIVIWIFWGCKTQSFCISPGWMLSSYFKLALVSLLTSAAHFSNGQFHIISWGFEHWLQVHQPQSQRDCWNTLLYWHLNVSHQIWMISF